MILDNLIHVKKKKKPIDKIFQILIKIVILTNYSNCKDFKF